MDRWGKKREVCTMTLLILTTSSEMNKAKVGGMVQCEVDTRHPSGQPRLGRCLASNLPYGPNVLSLELALDTKKPTPYTPLLLDGGKRLRLTPQVKDTKWIEYGANPHTYERLTEEMGTLVEVTEAMTSARVAAVGTIPADVSADELRKGRDVRFSKLKEEKARRRELETLAAEWFRVRLGQETPTSSPSVQVLGLPPHFEVRRDFREGASVYTDCSPTAVVVSPRLRGLDYIATPYRARMSREDPLLSFHVDRPTRAYVVCVHGTPRPSWLKGWERQSEDYPHTVQIQISRAGVDIRPFQVYSRDYPTGPVALGPLQTDPAWLDDSLAMYFVLLEAIGEAH